MVIHSDNRGAEVCPLFLVCAGFVVALRWQVSCRRGTARQWDHCQLVHAQWTQAAKLGVELFITRVNTDDNVADLPSRGVRSSCPLLAFVCVCVWRLSGLVAAGTFRFHVDAPVAGHTLPAGGGVGSPARALDGCRF